MTTNDRNQPFLRQLLNKPYNQTPFESLEISTATVDVRLVEDAKVNFAKLFQLLPIVPPELQTDKNMQWPPGTIYGGKFADEIRGCPPKMNTKGFKNSVTLWMWLKEKDMCVKISSDNLHMTGCKTLYQAAECARYVQQHMQLIHEEVPVYEIFPHISRFDICMINYNFNLAVGIDLKALDQYIMQNYPQIFISPYDENIHGSTMPLKLPMLLCSYTVYSNGQVCTRVKEIDLEKAMSNICKSYECFTALMQAFRKSKQ